MESALHKLTLHFCYKDIELVLGVQWEYTKPYVVVTEYKLLAGTRHSVDHRTALLLAFRSVSSTIVYSPELAPMCSLLDQAIRGDGSLRELRDDVGYMEGPGELAREEKKREEKKAQAGSTGSRPAHLRLVAKEKEEGES